MGVTQLEAITPLPKTHSACEHLKILNTKNKTRKMQNQKRSCNFLKWKDTVLYSAKLILNFNMSLKKKTRIGNTYL